MTCRTTSKSRVTESCHCVQEFFGSSTAVQKIIQFVQRGAAEREGQGELHGCGGGRESFRDGAEGGAEEWPVTK